MKQHLGNPLHLFYSYAPEDETLRNALDKHLILLQQNGLITTRDSRHIMPGADRSQSIGQYLKESRLILLLISPDYLASASCYTTEMPHALERHQKGDVLVIPVLLRPVDLDATPFAHLQYLPRNGKPVTLWDHQDTALSEIAKELRHLLDDVRATKPAFFEPSQIVEDHQPFQMHDESQTGGREELDYRIKYLKHLKERYSTVVLPIGPVEGLTLQAIFQPLALRYDPLATEDLQGKKQANLFDDSAEVPQEEKSILLAQTSEEALEKSPQKRIVVLGGPGTGKTTVLQFLIHEQAQKALIDPDAPLPLIISLPDLARSGMTLEEYLLRIVKEARVNGHFATVLEKTIDEGRAFICLDSLDEVVPEQRPDMIRLINVYAASAGNIWIIGSRFTEYKGGQFQRGQFAEWELLPMTHRLRQELAHRLLPELKRHFRRTREQSNTDPLVFVRLLETHGQAATWGESPLLFSLAAAVFVRLGTLPTSRAELYQEVTRAVLETREKNPLRRQVLRRVLTDLALELYSTKGRTFSLDFLSALLPDIRRRQYENWATDEMARRIIHSGLFDTLSQDTYSFRHQTFQEYLAAEELAQRLVTQDQERRENAWAFAWSKRRYARWTEVLRLMVGILVQNHEKEGIHRAGGWLRALAVQQETPEGDPGNLGLALALKSLGEISKTASFYWNQECGNKIEEELVASWIARLFDAFRQGYEIQRQHLEYLSYEFVHLRYLLAKTAIERTKAALCDEKSEVRIAAIRELGMLGACAPTEPLVAALHDSEGTVRVAAATALGDLYEKMPVEPLLVAAHDPLEEVRAAAIEALGQLDESAPPEPIIAALGDPAWNVRKAAVEALGEPGVLISLDRLVSIMHDNDPAVRTAVVEMLGSMGEQAPQEPLLVALRDQAWKVRGAAAEALGQFGERMPIDPLLEAMNASYSLDNSLHDEEMRARNEIVRSLTKQIERVPVEPLQAMMEQANGYNDKYKYLSTRISIIRIIAEMGVRAPLSLVLTALHDEVWSVRREVVRAIGVLKVTAAHETVLALLKDGYEHESVRVAALDALTNLEDDRGVSRLLEALNDPMEEVRRAASQNLARRTMLSTPEELLMIANQHFSWIRLVVVAILGKLGKNAPIDLLLDLLGDENEAEVVRAAAGRALVDLGEAVPIKEMREILQHKNARIRQGIAEKFLSWNVLAFTEDIPVVSLLLALEHENRDVRWRAANKLAYDQVGSRAYTLFAKQELLTLKNWLCSREKSAVPVGVLDVLAELLLKKDYWEVARVLGGLKADMPVEFVQRLFAAAHDEQSKKRFSVFQALKELGNHLSNYWLIEAMTDERWQWRKTAIYLIGLRKEVIFVQPLLNALNDSQWQVRVAAAQALEKISEPPPVELLLAALHDEQMCVRLAVASTLTTFSLPFSLTPVLEALTHQDVAPYLGTQNHPDAWDDEERELCHLIAQILEKLGKSLPREMLSSAALYSEDMGIRKAAIHSLTQHDGEIPWKLLLNSILKAEKNWREVSFVFSQIEDLPERALEDAYSQGTLGLRQGIAYLLGMRGKKAPEKLLIQIMDEENEAIQQSVAWGLGFAGENLPTELLIQALQHGSSRMRQTVVRVLDRTNGELPPNLLLAALRDKDRQVRVSAAGAMTNQVWQGPLEPLIACLHTETDNSVLQRIVRTLGGRSLEEEIPLGPLLNLCEREYTPLRASVIRILGRFGGHPDVEELLIATLGDSEQAVRDAAAAALKQAYPEALSALASKAISILQGQKPSAPFDSIAQTFFADAVMNMEYTSPAVFERLTQLLDWPYWRVRLKAIQALGRLRHHIPDQAIRRLYVLRHDPISRAVREAADRVLAEILSLETGIEDD